MILVADSGSTKTDWMIVDEKSPMHKYSTAGFNPYFHDRSFIIDELKKNTELLNLSPKIKAIRFFGAGCSSPERNEVVRGALAEFFTNAEIHVESDMVGAVLSTCGDEQGIVGILGTGSNSCFYDGGKIHKNNFGLGFIMGDEGGGSYFGRKLITHYLYGIMPENITKKFNEQFEMNKEIMIANVYNNPKANVWLASFAKFFVDNREDEWVKKIVRKGMEEFFELYVCSYPNFKEVNVHFVGSMAYYFDEIIRDIARERQVRLKKIVRHPINHLAEYFLSKK
ncbi:MAG TPA: N-acetylglucosamine kinase [Bacteroidia bacterium]|nr:N-acetylglucosamine kinase [Bacteroidota bacterium]MBK7429473.1 N-acetylglucosamine kinase [Bacteroidota bacterium]MBP9790379.1 N-acetylglucosamine kinase [Bacteroidia bacterium]HQW22776.1 N-acetylglucosamine kinase [Bacteroidia bacterium]